MKALIFIHFLILQIVLSQRGIDPRCNLIVKNFVYSENNAYIEWNPVNAECATTPNYNVTYIIDGSDEQWVSPIPNSQIAMIPLKTITCERVEAQIFVSENDKLIGQSEWTIMIRVLDEVNGLKASQQPEGIFIEWEPLNIGESCPETYTLQYDIDTIIIDPIELTEPNYLIELTDESPCTTINVNVIAKINDFASEPAKTKYEIKIPPVENFILKNENGKVLVDFDRNTITLEKCGDFDYRVTYEDLGCFNTSFQVIPRSKLGTEGIVATEEIVRQPGVVKNPIITVEGEEVVLNWSPPQGAEDCNMMYLIDIDKKISSTALTTIRIPVELESCVEAKLAKITPVILFNMYDNVQGISVELPIETGLKGVTNLKCEKFDVEVKCEWNKPTESDNCEKILYKINYYNGKENDYETEETSFNFDLGTKFCAIWFNIQPIGYFNEEEIPGKIIEATIEGC